MIRDLINSAKLSLAINLQSRETTRVILIEFVNGENIEKTRWIGPQPQRQE